MPRESRGTDFMASHARTSFYDTFRIFIRQDESSLACLEANVVTKAIIEDLLRLSAEKNAFVGEPVIAEQQLFYADMYVWGETSTMLVRIQKDDGAWTEWTGRSLDMVAAYGFLPPKVVDLEEELTPSSSGGHVQGVLGSCGTSSRMSPSVCLPSLPASGPMFDQHTEFPSFDINQAINPNLPDRQLGSTGSLMGSTDSFMDPKIMDGFGLSGHVFQDDVDYSAAVDHAVALDYPAGVINSSVPFDFNMPNGDLDMGLDISMPNGDLDFGLDFNMPAFDLEMDMDLGSFELHDTVQRDVNPMSLGDILDKHGPEL